MIRLFDSPASLAAECAKLGTMSHGSRYEERNNWYGDPASECCIKARIGDPALVPEAERLLDQLDTQIEVPRHTWERAPVGHFCVVPDVLAGLPTPMRRQREVGDEHAPIAVIACSTISSGISLEKIRNRGITILALAMALSRMRPISLHTVATTGGERGDRDETVLCTRIETAPLDLAQAAWTLTNAGWARRLNYSLAAKLNGFLSGWPKRYNTLGEARYIDYLGDALAPLLGIERNRTLVIGPTHLHDPLADDPLPWIRRQIAHFTTENADAPFA